jgi:TatD DNase family protein
MWVDAHTHLDHYTADQLPAALAEIDALQMLTLANSMDLASYRRNLEIAADSPHIVVGLGVHPARAAACVDQLEAYRPFLADASFIGEIGLDYHWVEDSTTYPAQRTVFEFFLAAARDLDKPINLHTKGAEADILDLLDRYRIRRAIVHWYSGPLDLLRKLIDFGCAFTIGVELHHSALIRQVACQVPLAQLLTETDNPGGLEWLTGEVGYPRHVLPVVAELAQLRGVPEEQIRTAVHENMQRLLQGNWA